MLKMSMTHGGFEALHWVGKALPFRGGFNLFGRQAHKHNLLESGLDRAM